MGPQSTTSTFLNPDPSASGGNVLARKPRSEHVNRFHISPVDAGDVAEVGHARQPNIKNLSDVGIGISAPGDTATTERGQHAQVQPTRSGTQRPDHRPRRRHEAKRLDLDIRSGSRPSS